MKPSEIYRKAALQLARDFLEGAQLRHAVVNYPDSPPRTLGESLDNVLAKWEIKP